MSKEEFLKPVTTTEEAKERGKNGGIKSGEVRREKKLMSQIYAEFLAKEHNIIMKDGQKDKLSGQALVDRVISKVLARGDSASVSMCREIREGTEGSKIDVNIGSLAEKRLLDYMDEQDIDNLADHIKK